MTYNLTGKVIGNIKVIEKLTERNSFGNTQWKCLCLCGNIFNAITARLTTNNSKKRQECCGNCKWHIKHKESYISWMGMKQRCNDPNVKDYKYYGGRGITYSKNWEKFTNFYIDMGDPPYSSLTGERLTLDRENVNGNYTKENCIWSTRSEQQLNKR